MVPWVGLRCVIVVFPDHTHFHFYMGLDARKPVFGGLANNTGADQPAHMRSLISAFVIRVLESSIYKLASGDI